jgi:hypothetical protein
MNMDDYPHFFLTEDGRLCSTAQHCPRFLWVLYNTLIRLSYNGEVPIYRCCLSMVDSLDMCEINVIMPLDPMELWIRTVVGSEPDTTVE